MIDLHERPNTTSTFENFSKKDQEHKRKVYIVQNTKSMMLYGCFNSKIKANKYINGNKDFFIIKSNVI